jgi:dTDP-4-amino-4,6-dideoxygalactose transaminase
MNIPFSPPFVDKDTIDEVVDSLTSGWITSGPKVKSLEEEICKLTRVSRSVCVNSWTSGAILVLKWFGVKEGDEVIVFGAQPNIETIAKAADTIPYEILTGISARVKRVYFQE